MRRPRPALTAVTAACLAAAILPPAAAGGTWVVDDAGAIRVPAPPAAGSVEARAELRERRALRRERSAGLEREIRAARNGLAIRPWLEMAMDRVALGDVADPPSASRAYALLGVAMDDAGVVARRFKRRYDRPSPRRHPDDLLGPEPGSSYPSEHAAVAAAAARVLARTFPDQPAARFEDAARRAADVRVAGGASRRSDVEAGLALGRRVGDAVLARGRGDGHDRRWDVAVPAGPGHWAPPPGVTAAPVQPLAGSWQPWVLRSGDQLRPPPPPAYGSPAFDAEAREVMAVHAALTPEQRAIARHWAAGAGTSFPPGLWNEIAMDRLRRGRPSLARQARVAALLNVAMADAGIAAWDAKYAYWSPRPVNAIRDLGLAPGWTPLLGTPRFPGYVSGHATYSGAAAEVLAARFPAHAARLRASAREAAMSRLYGGIHFRSDNEAGARLGRSVGRLVVRAAGR